jgi:hypothetical protein
MQCPNANLFCAVAFDDHNIKIAPMMRMIFTIEGPPNMLVCVRAYDTQLQ